MTKNFFPKIVQFMTMWKNMVELRQTTDEYTIWRMRFAFWIIKATDIHSQYVILLSFVRQQWLRERASMLRLY